MVFIRNIFQNSVKSYPPAFSAGLMVFMVLIELLQLTQFPNLADNLKLKPSTLTDFELNRLSFYPVVHMNLIHLIINSISLYPLVRRYELENGTVRTGIILNLLAAFPGLAYIVFCFIFGETNSVLGASGWCFSLLSYFTLKEFRQNPNFHLYGDFTVPTWAIPFIYLILMAIFVPQSSFIGHLICLGFGWLLEMGYLDILFVKSTKVVEFIETKLAPAIELIPNKLKYITEVQAREIRTDSRTSALPVVSDPADYPGAGQQLGQV